jgi:hypothetical protein
VTPSGAVSERAGIATVARAQPVLHRTWRRDNMKSAIPAVWTE